MSHMVIYRTADGQPGYHQTDELDEAIKYVERLRNGDGVDGARIFRLDEVNFDFRPYFKVEIGPSGEPSTAEPMAAPSLVADPGPGGPNGHHDPVDFEVPAAPAPAQPAAAPPAEAPPADVWGEHGADFDAEPSPLVEQASSFMADAPVASAPEPPEPEEPEEAPAGDGLGARRGLFGR